MPLLESFILLIAIQVFAVGDFQKGLLSAARFIGMMAGLFAGVLAGRTNVRKSWFLAVLSLIAALFLCGGSLTTSAVLFMVFLVLYQIIMELRLPFITAIYADNYRKQIRGKNVSAGVVTATLLALIISYLSKRVLNLNIMNYRYMFIVFVGLLVLSSFMFSRIPSKRVIRKTGVIKSFKLLKEYPKFSYILFVWFIFGLGNLLSFPLRIVYLAEEGRGLGLDPGIVILLTSIIPAASKLLSGYFWGILFDKINVVMLRIILNIFIGAGIFMFFQSSNLYVIGASVIITYIGFGGTPLVWNLWVTKIVPAEKVQEAMSLHTFFTGVRGIIGPFIGFFVIAHAPIRSVGLISGLMFLASIFMLLPLSRTDHFHG